MILIAKNAVGYLNHRVMLKYISGNAMKSLLPTGKNADTLEKEAVGKEILVYLNTLNQGNARMEPCVDT